LIEDLLPVTNF